MKRLIIIPALLALSGCGLTSMFTPPAGLPSAPAVLVNSTTLDEQGALGVELAYKAARTALEVGVDGGLIKGARATQMAALDNKAFDAVQIARRAYKAGNATDYATGLAQARLAIADMIALAK